MLLALVSVAVMAHPRCHSSPSPLPSPSVPCLLFSCRRVVVCASLTQSPRTCYKVLPPWVPCDRVSHSYLHACSR
ncbi:hypothetical protein LZ30DRAFT_720230 [Colletotrichum cereale]|nr:hypothetical protein LZ30DRAFT_720230 [Colletotrichum cereale]